MAAETRPAGRFVLVASCIRVCHVGSVCCGVHGRIADGVRAARTVGAHRRLFHGRPRTGSAGCRGRRRPVCQEGCGGFAFRSFAGVAPGGSKDFGKFAGLARLAPCGPSGRAAGSVAERHANCRSAGRAGPLWRAPRRVARTDGHAGSRACGAAWACNSDVPADGFHAPGSTACSVASGLVPADPSSVPGWVMWPAAAGGRCHRWRAGWGAVMAGHIIITARQAS